jgi:hypothetical protein
LPLPEEDLTEENDSYRVLASSSYFNLGTLGLLLIIFCLQNNKCRALTGRARHGPEGHHRFEMQKPLQKLLMAGEAGISPEFPEGAGLHGYSSFFFHHSM